MAAYEVEPDLLEQVSLTLIKQVRSLYAEKQTQSNSDEKPSTKTAMSDEAEKGCYNRI